MFFCLSDVVSSSGSKIVDEFNGSYCTINANKLVTPFVSRLKKWDISIFMRGVVVDGLLSLQRSIEIAGSTLRNSSVP